jgi:hypothetical protein
MNYYIYYLKISSLKKYYPKKNKKSKNNINTVKKNKIKMNKLNKSLDEISSSRKFLKSHLHFIRGLHNGILD